MRTVRICSLHLLVFVLVVGCQVEHAPTDPVGERLDVPAGSGSGQPRLYTASDGAVWLSWVEPLDDSTHALRSATLTDTTWSAPSTVAVGTDWFVNWADLPSVRPLPDGRAAAHYLQSNGSSALAYAVRVTQRPRGGSWQTAVSPHADDSPTEHGFVSMVPWSTDQLLTVWLDGRKMSTGEGHGHGEMSLRSALLDSTGAVVQRTQVDGRTCECCATSLERVSDDEALLAYRDRSADEIRDISLVRFDGEQWTEPTPLHTDGWEIEGCPVNGPALAARGDRVVAAWFTAAAGVPRVKVAFSTDGGHRFTEPVVVAEGQTKGRVDAALLDDGSAVVSWLADADGRGQVQLRTVRADSTLGTVATMAVLSSASRRAGFPKMVRSGEHLYGVWVQPEGESGASQVQGARVPVQSLR